MSAVADSSRLADLERRVESDPASIAFAQLAEEYRRAGRLEEAVRVCRAGLAQYPDYQSARVTLGRALRALGRDEEARPEFDSVALQTLQAWLDAIMSDRQAPANSLRQAPDVTP